MRSLDELIDASESSWPIVESWLSKARNQNEILPITQPHAAQTLLALQITTRSPMGAIAHTSGGLLFDHGWLRFLGSGHPRMARTLSDWNAVTEPRMQHRLPGGLLFADDAVGGFFALNGGAFDTGVGQVHYFAPDMLEWKNTQLGYSDFLQWECQGDLGQFYANSRWPGWEQDVAKLSGDRTVSIYPFLWAEGPDIDQRSRAEVPVTEIWESQKDMRRQMQEQARKENLT